MVVHKSSKTRKTNLGPYFGHFILTCILVNTVQLAIFTPWDGQDSRMTRMLDIIDTISFTIELLAKYIALGWSAFIKPGWNKLDFFIVSTSDMDMTLTCLEGSRYSADSSENLQGISHISCFETLANNCQKYWDFG